MVPNPSDGLVNGPGDRGAETEVANPLVSVVVPTRNSGRTLGACLLSIRRQTYREIQLIVVDNHSCDDTREIAERFADKLVVEGPERSAQRNRGALESTGEYLVFVDSDMELEPEVVADSVGLILQSSARAIVIPENSIGEGFWARCRALERSCYTGDDLIEAARFFPRSVFAASGGFDETLHAGEDWDLSVRVAAGRTLPRSAARILHNEGRIRLHELFRKKRYYAKSFRTYYRKHPSLALRQANIIVRPAFLRNWRNLIRHPILTPALLFLKAVELSASVVGLMSLQGGAPAISRKQLK
jgi:glycosyltransferase involved in cell wall biosynthesis